MENIIHVNINPLITGFSNWVISWHGFFSFVAVLFSVILVGRWAEDYNLDQDTVYHVAIWGIIGGVIGARIVHVIDYWWFYQNQPLDMFMLWKGGIGVWGGVIGGFAGGVLCAHINKYPKYVLTDLAAPALMFGMVIGRIGDIINGEHCAKAYEGVFAMSWDHAASDVTNCKMKGSGIGVPVQPAIIYEMIWNMLSIYIIWYFRFKLYPSGMTWVLFLLLYSIGRLIISYLRYDKIWVPINFLGMDLSITEAQVIAIICILISLPILIINVNYKNFISFQYFENDNKTRAEKRRKNKTKK